MGEGTKPQQLVDQLIAADPKGTLRQLGMINAAGETAQFTGTECQPWAGGQMGQNYAAQGNILTGPKVVQAMAQAFEESLEKASLAERLIQALEAGQAAGGDKRGQQAAALLVVREGWGYAGGNDRYIDLRVDDHTAPIAELGRLFGLHQKLFGR
jgi:uncharacterized Ntn-hydrolase superfamily protein